MQGEQASGVTGNQADNRSALDDPITNHTTDGPRRGRLKIYLGATPGAGKTFAMLNEGRRLTEQGHDVVAGYVETYHRPMTVAALSGLKVMPRKKVTYRGAELEDMDLDALLLSRPETVLVDELAHTNAPGLRNGKRWQDVEDLRQDGIDVISTVNVQHVESVKDLVERITGIPVRETVPDRELDGADEIQFIDIAPEALRKRMRHGNIYAQEKVDTALRNFFRHGNLAALRQIGLRLVADSMARSRTVIASPEDVMVAVSCGPATEDLIRRGARLARRLGGSCMVVCVLPVEAGFDRVERYRVVSSQVGASFTLLGGPDIAGAVIAAAHEAGAEHVVLGEVTAARGLARLQPSLVDRVIDGLPDSDVHVIAQVEQ
jgi:two-component system, OmpR family, sensor histidine kinase KdpD